MSSVSSTTRVSTRPAWPLLLAGAGALAGAAALRAAGTLSSATLDTFSVIFLAIVVEALPFILLGAIVSAAIEVFVPAKAFERIGRLPAALQIPGAALGGFAFPVCECGSVPVARRLISRGVHPAAGITFMLASPVLNPIVLLTTYVAYSPRGLGWEMVGGRAALGLVVAVIAGWSLGTEGAEKLLRPRPGDESHGEHGTGMAAFTEHLARDLFLMGSFIVLGAGIAAAMQTVIPQSVVAGVATTPIVGSLALMAVAAVMSLCSEADAFVAVSFVPFPLGSQLAFLVFGPIFDSKLALLYGATFRGRFVLRLVAVAVPVTLAGALWFEAVIA